MECGKWAVGGVVMRKGKPLQWKTPLISSYPPLSSSSSSFQALIPAGCTDPPRPPRVPAEVPEPALWIIHWVIWGERRTGLWFCIEEREEEAERRREEEEEEESGGSAWAGFPSYFKSAQKKKKKRRRGRGEDGAAWECGRAGSVFLTFTMFSLCLRRPFCWILRLPSTGWGSSLCCWLGCDSARYGDDCASYCLASAGVSTSAWSLRSHSV